MSAKIDKLKGSIELPGDKSLSHRAVILASMAKGISKIRNFLPAEDTINILKVFQKLGISVKGDISSGNLEIKSNGIESFQSPEEKLELGNSGTAARLLIGLFSGKSDLDVTIDGDHTLRKRPMKRVTEPLSKYGAVFSSGYKLPIRIKGQQLNEIDYKETLGSAQVKSACILAAISSQININLKENVPSRDHTENMLSFCGVPIKKDKIVQDILGRDKLSYVIHAKPPYSISAKNFDLWGDISSAAFFIVAALLIGNSEITVENILLNPYRDRYIKFLLNMGADISIEEKKEKCGERGGDIKVKSSFLKNIRIPLQSIPSLIDEIPILSIAGMFSEGTFAIRNAKELRYKESDRIHSICYNLKNLGLDVKTYSDGFEFVGRPGHSFKGKINSFYDHRIIMSFEVANLISKKNAGMDLKKTKKELIEISDKDKKWIHTSFPSFYEKLNQLM